jgi:serine/threonine protein phosphatase 1
LFLEYKDYKTNDNRYLVVSHSSVEAKWIYKDFSIESKEYKELQNSVLNGRYKNFDNRDIFNVYGHTPVNNVTSSSYQANIDLGCYSREEMENPRLCALEFPSMNVYIQKVIEGI